MPKWTLHQWTRTNRFVLGSCYLWCHAGGCIFKESLMRTACQIRCGVNRQGLRVEHLHLLSCNRIFWRISEAVHRMTLLRVSLLQGASDVVSPQERNRAVRLLHSAAQLSCQHVFASVTGLIKDSLLWFVCAWHATAHQCVCTVNCGVSALARECQSGVQKTLLVLEVL